MSQFIVPIERDGKTIPVEVQDTLTEGRYTVASTSDPEQTYTVVRADQADPACTCKARNGCIHLLAVADLRSRQRSASMALAIAQPSAPPTQTALVRAGAELRADMTTRVQLMKRAAMEQVEILSQALILGQSARAAGIVPAGIDTDEKAALVVIRALEMGIPYSTAFSYLYVVNGRISVQSEMIGALVNRSGLGRIEILETSRERAVVRGVRKGYPPLTITYTMADATDAGAFDQGQRAKIYKAHGADMLRWKAIARVGRLLFSDILNGMDVTDGEGLVVEEAYTDQAEVVVEEKRHKAKGKKGKKGQAENTPTGPESGPPENSGPPPLVTDAQAERPAWWPAYGAAMLDAGFTHRMAREFLDVEEPGSAALIAAIDAWLNQEPPTTPAGLVRSIADWEATEKKVRGRVIIPPVIAPTSEIPASQEEPKPEAGDAEGVAFAAPCHCGATATQTEGDRWNCEDCAGEEPEDCEACRRWAADADEAAGNAQEANGAAEALALFDMPAESTPPPLRGNH